MKRLFCDFCNTDVTKQTSQTSVRKSVPMSLHGQNCATVDVVVKVDVILPNDDDDTYEICSHCSAEAASRAMHE